MQHLSQSVQRIEAASSAAGAAAPSANRSSPDQAVSQYLTILDAMVHDHGYLIQNLNETLSERTGHIWGEMEHIKGSVHNNQVSQEQEVS